MKTGKKDLENGDVSNVNVILRFPEEHSANFDIGVRDDPSCDDTTESSTDSLQVTLACRHTIKHYF